MLGWGQLEDDHVGYSCYKAGDCAKVTDHICDPSKCTGLTFTLGSKLRVVSVAERAEFLLALRFDRGRATNLPLNRIRRHLKPADIADLEKMAR